MNKLAFRFSAVVCAATSMMAAESPTIPPPWSSVLQPAYGEWRVVSIWEPYEHTRPSMSLDALVAMAVEETKKGKTEPKPSYTDVEAKGKSLPVYYESAPRKQICVAAARYGSPAEARAAYKKEVARTINPGSAEILHFRVVKKGEHKDAADKVLGPWILLESDNEGQFAEKAYWTQAEYVFSAESTIADFRAGPELPGENAPRKGPTRTWETIKTDEEIQQFRRGSVENFLSVALRR